MDLSRDSLYYLIKEEQIPHYNKINCFYFSDCYFQELLSLLGNKKLMKARRILPSLKFILFTFTALGEK